MARRESDEFNFVGLAHSPIKQTPGPAGYYVGEHNNSGGESFSAAKTERMSTGSIVGSSATSRRRQALNPVAANALDLSPTSKTPLASPSSLALLSSSISSKRSMAHAALAARRSSLPVSRTLRMSPALGGDDSAAGASSVDRAAGRGTRSSTPSDRYPDENSGYGSVSRAQRGGGSLFSPPYADASLHTPHGSACSRSPASAHPATAARRLASQSPSMISYAFTPSHGFAKEYPCSASAIVHQPSTPVMADPDLSSTSTAVGGSTQGSDGGGDWSECSFTHAVFSPEPATPAPPCAVHRSARGDRDSSREEVAPTTEVAHNPSAARSESSTTSSRGGGGDSNRRSVARSPVLTAAHLVREDAPSTPAAAAALAAMMAGGVPAAVAVCGTVEEEGDWSDGGDLFSERPFDFSMDVQVKPRATAPQSPSRTDAIAARRPVMTPRRPIAASALLELSAGTPRRMIRGIIGGVGPSGYSRQQQQQQQQSFVPRVAKVVENIEEETPRRFIKGVLADGQAAAANPAACEPTSAPTLVGRSGCYSSASVAAAAAAATAAAAKTAAAAAIAPAEESPGAQGEAAQGRDRVDGDANSVQQEVEVAVREEPVSVSSAVVSAERGAEGRSSVSAPGVGKAVLKTVLILSAIVLVVGALFVVFVLTCVVFAGPPLSVPIH